MDLIRNSRLDPVADRLLVQLEQLGTERPSETHLARIESNRVQRTLPSTDIALLQ